MFRYPLDIKEDYVKRAIGIPGDRIKLVNKQLILNGHAVNEPYAQHIRPRTSIPTAITSPPRRRAWAYARRPSRCWQTHVVNGELVVPPGFIFAMGDNRDDSLDSRYWGFVPRENIEGRRWLSTGRSTRPTAGPDQREHRRRPHRWTW